MTSKNYRILLYIYVVISIFFGSKAKVTTEQQPHPVKNEVWVTVFVHGIMSIKPHLSMENFFNLLNDTVEETSYAKTVELMRNDPFFYKNQAMQGFGLQKVEVDYAKGNASGALVHLFNQVRSHCNIPDEHNHYYTYGWSGLLSKSVRYKNAFGLFTALEQLVYEYQQQGITPKIRLIGYSHGGNVCLNLAAIHQQEFPYSPLAIHQLILIGMPVVPESDYLVTDPMFKRVYHLYSNKDRVQTLDLFSTNRTFSNRTFEPRKNFKIPDTLTQIEIKITRFTRGVKEKQKRAQLTNDFSKNNVVTGTTHLLRNSSPGHVELWFFGWTPAHYRKTYPLYPLPTVFITPFILYHMHLIEKNSPLPQRITFDIRPDNAVAVIKQHDQRIHKHHVVPFIPYEKLVAMKTTIFNFAPEYFTDDIYHEHIQMAYTKVQKFSTKKLKSQKEQAAEALNNLQVAVKI